MKNSKVQNPSPKVKPQLTQSRLKELMDYDPLTGVFTCKVARGNRKIGSIAGCTDVAGYTSFTIDGGYYRAARLAFMWMKGYFPEHDVDHIDRVKNNDRWSNLRHVSRKCNSRNCSISKGNTSGITGVYFNANANRWISQISVDMKTIYLGCFKTKREAAQSRWEGEVKYGYPGCNTTSSAYQYLQRATAHAFVEEGGSRRSASGVFG